MKYSDKPSFVLK